jgi:hypothetical protein
LPQKEEETSVYLNPKNPDEAMKSTYVKKP